MYFLNNEEFVSKNFHLLQKITYLYNRIIYFSFICMQQVYNCYQDGNFTDYEKVNVGLVSNSLNYGTSVIESIRFYKSDESIIAINLDYYIERFLAWLKESSFSISEKHEDIKKILSYLLKLNKHLEHPYIRLIVYVGDDSIDTMSMDTHFAAHITSLPRRYIKDGLSATFSSFLRPEYIGNTMKLSCNYAKTIIEQRKVQKDGNDVVIFLWASGEVLECLSENIFMIHNNICYTPKVGNIVDGINRRMVIEILHDLWIEVCVQDITPEFLWQADEIFITGTATGIRNILSLNGKMIWNAWTTQEIKDTYTQIFSWEKVFSSIDIQTII